jgi:bifunctional DNase/RNase
MERVQLFVLGLAATASSNNAYAVFLKEVDGDRRLPIVIGAFEAQAIGLEMEGVTPPRPMTHDLMKTIIESLGSNLTEIFINDIIDGTFYAKLIFEDDGFEIDARPSDAIALAIRFNAPIYASANVIEEAGMNNNSGEDFEATQFARNNSEITEDKEPIKKSSKNKIDKLHNQLDKAIKDEDYELAASIRDEIQKSMQNPENMQ